jgi:hypothetical protein
MFLEALSWSKKQEKEKFLRPEGLSCGLKNMQLLQKSRDFLGYYEIADNLLGGTCVDIRAYSRGFFFSFHCAFF